MRYLPKFNTNISVESLTYRDRVVSDSTISKAEKTLGFKFPEEYKAYLRKPIEESNNSSNEYIGLEFPNGELNVVECTLELQNATIPLPSKCVALMAIGNGDYYIYNTVNKTIGIYCHDDEIEYPNKPYTKSITTFANWAFGNDTVSNEDSDLNSLYAGYPESECMVAIARPSSGW